MKYPDLLGILLNFLKSGSNPAIRKEVGPVVSCWHTTVFSLPCPSGDACARVARRPGPSQTQAEPEHGPEVRSEGLPLF